MFYNIEMKKVKTDLDCFDCPHFDKKTKDCNGIGVACFEFDPLTKTCLDPITKLPFKPSEEK